jgi:hypothetical protein
MMLWKISLQKCLHAKLISLECSSCGDNDSDRILTPNTPSINRARNVGQKFFMAKNGEAPVRTPLRSSETPTTWRPPHLSAITPPSSDVTKYPQKKPPRMYDCCFFVQGYRVPYCYELISQLMLH